MFFIINKNKLNTNICFNQALEQKFTFWAVKLRGFVKDPISFFYHSGGGGELREGQKSFWTPMFKIVYNTNFYAMIKSKQHINHISSHNTKIKITLSLKF